MFGFGFAGPSPLQGLCMICMAGWECMSPVSPVFHIKVTASIGLKNVLRVGI